MKKHKLPKTLRCLIGTNEYVNKRKLSEQEERKLKHMVDTWYKAYPLLRNWHGVKINDIQDK